MNVGQEITLKREDVGTVTGIVSRVNQDGSFSVRYLSQEIEQGEMTDEEFAQVATRFVHGATVNDIVTE